MGSPASSASRCSISASPRLIRRPSLGFAQVYPQQFGSTSSDLKSASAAAAAIDVMEVAGQGQYNDEDTNLNAPLSFAAQNLPVSGTGSSASAPQQVVFLVSDGVNDTYSLHEQQRRRLPSDIAT